ncbi:hypothetical protein DV738_g1224, partial [Chaetothyriales sp. CBS 135597]
MSSQAPAAASDQYILFFYVPSSHTEKCLSAIHATGAGSFPSADAATYSEAAFIIPGQGQFRPLQGANPHTGTVGKLEKMEEDKVEVIVFGREVVKAAVKALKESHPYEAVAYGVTRCEDF